MTMRWREIHFGNGFSLKKIQIIMNSFNFLNFSVEPLVPPLSGIELLELLKLTSFFAIFPVDIKDKMCV